MININNYSKNALKTISRDIARATELMDSINASKSVIEQHTRLMLKAQQELDAIKERLNPQTIETQHPCPNLCGMCAACEAHNDVVCLPAEVAAHRQTFGDVGASNPTQVYRLRVVELLVGDIIQYTAYGSDLFGHLRVVIEKNDRAVTLATLEQPHIPVGALFNDDSTDSVATSWRFVHHADLEEEIQKLKGNNQ